MVPPFAVHPTDDDLRAALDGSLPETDAANVFRHLEDCPACQRKATDAPADEFARWVRTAARTDRTPLPDETLDRSDVLRELAGHPVYQIVRELGRGGMGVVYQARNRDMGRDEVLKVVAAHLLARPGAADRFLREVKSAAQLHHPNVVTAFATLRVGRQIALAMEYVPGRDLEAVVKADGPLPVRAACEYVRQAALGLQHAADKGLAHRDVKPSNLILADDSVVVKILDFGLARATAEADGTDGSPAVAGLTGTGKMLGTPDYMAPEQIADAATADSRADIYSLGGTLFYLLTGRPPFRAATVDELLRMHESAAPEPLDRLRPDVPPALAAVVLKMLAKRTADRFQTPAEVAAALEPFTHDVPARRAWLWVAAGLLIAGLALAAVFSLRTREGIIIIDGVPADAVVEAEEGTVTVSRSGESVKVSVSRSGRYRLKAVRNGVTVWTNAAQVELGGKPVGLRFEENGPPAIPTVGPTLPSPIELAPAPRRILTANDRFNPRTVWKGTRKYVKGMFSPSKVHYELHVHERIGRTFRGVVFDNGPGRNRAQVEGEIDGDTITWRERANHIPDGKMTMSGKLVGDTISVTFIGFYGIGRAMNEGVGDLTLLREHAPMPRAVP